MGAPITAATVSAPSARIVVSSSWRRSWYQSGAPNKKKIIGRYGEGVGGTLACRSTGGLPAMFGPTLPNYIQVQPGNASGGCSACRPRGGKCDLTCAQQLEDTIR